ncbi:hypothetical protein [Aquabacter spiritensis]|uniref:DUF1835 domain-containing protein n=1 Tax=Aquabacter spiritensis TaxID=933073 RepID=A0A4R3LPF4_9HYPH|nr:hypothetical protein [Aquabacter spiritensis]TCT02363.1 hypothetical protein EDC64_1136 [Aquabacter spiritensis]
MARLLVTNGDCAAAALRAVGVPGRLLPWRDGLHDGPVPADDRLDMVSDARAGFLAAAMGLAFDAVRADFAVRDGVIEAHIAYDTVELWFEHDLYDQLQLIQLLAFFASEPDRRGLFLVQADTYLGPMAPDAIAGLAPAAAPVRAIQLEAGRAAWAAFTAATPEALAAFAARPVPGLPHLAPALRRALAELPAPGNGLSLTQARAMAALAAGPSSAARLFAAVSVQEAARFLGDLSFFLQLDDLAFAPTPLISGLPHPVHDCPAFTPAAPPTPAEAAYRAYAEAPLALTAAGRAALSGSFDHAAENAVTRWLGGTHLRPGALWRYDRDRARLVAPD